MSNFVHVPQYGGMPAPMSATDTSQRFELGLQVFARDMGQSNAAGTAAATATAPTIGGGVFQYAVGASASAPQSRGQLVFMPGNSAILANTANASIRGPVGIAAGAISATNVYGWVQVQGLCDYARVNLTGAGANASLLAHVGATLGEVQNNVSATGTKLLGVNFWSTQASDAAGTAGSGSVQLQYPTMGVSAI